MPTAPSAPLLELRQVSRSFREGDVERPVLRQASFTLERGELVVLLGRSGSGKSTVLNLASGIDLPSSGEVRFDGRDLGAMSEEERTLLRRRHVGFIFQSFNLIPTLTVAENLFLPLDLNGRSKNADRAQALELLASVGLGDRRNAFPDRLSGGEQQRLAVARAIAHDPLLVLADEPTGNLDLETGREVLQLLDRLTRQAGKAMLMVTHAVEFVGMADRVLTLSDGNVVEQRPAGPG